MLEHQSVVDDIRSFCAAIDQTKSPELIELANRYAALCEEINLRLRRCIDYLRRGLRAEAIHLAEEHPNLLEMVAAVDFPEHGQWASLCAMYELARPRTLLIESAQELNEAYSAAQPLRHLLDRHRRLALECGRLVDRIAVMRQLAAADPASPFWDADIRTFELARIKEIKSQATAAINAKDRPTIVRLLAEVNEEGWRVDRPLELRTVMERAQSSIGQRDAIHQVRLLIGNLELAYGAMDIKGVSSTLASIRHLTAAGGIALPLDLAERVAPVEAWQAQRRLQAQREEVIEAAWADLALAVSVNAPAAKLQEIKSEAIDLGGTIDPELDRQMTAIIDAQAAAISRRKLRRAALIAASTIIVLSGIGVGVFFEYRESRGWKAFEKISQHYGDHDLPAVQEDLARLKSEAPYALNRPDIRHIQELVSDEMKNEAERRAKYESAFRLAQSAIAQAENTSVATDAVWKPAMTAVSEAEHLARSDSEQKAARTLLQLASVSRSKIQKKVQEAEEQKFEKALTELRSQTSELEASASSGVLTRGDATLATATREASDLFSSVPEGPRVDELKKDAESLTARLTGIAKRVGRADMEHKQLEAVKAATSPAALTAALGTFVRELPDTEHSAHFSKALKNADAWVAVDEAAKLAAAWNFELDCDSAALPQRAAAAGTFADKYPSCPWAPAFRDYKLYLLAWQQAIAKRGPWKGEFTANLNEPLMKSVRVMRSSEGKIYYLPADEVPRRDSLGTNFSYVAGGNLKLLKRVHGMFDNDPVASSQSALSRDLCTMIDSLGSNWSTFGFDVMSRIGEAKEVDPILRVILLEQASNAWQKASWGVDRLLLSVAGALGKADADDLAWMDPDNTQANARRETMLPIIADQIAELKRGREAVLEKQHDMRSRLLVHVDGHGVLILESTGWTVATADATKAGQRAFTVTSNGDWLQIAEFRDRQFRFDSKQSLDKGQDGNMVFIVAPSPVQRALPGQR